MNRRQELFPAMRSWPPAVDDLSGISTEATQVQLVAGAKNFRRLEALGELKTLCCVDINDEALEAICNCRSLESLFIENLKTADLSRLGRLGKLSTLHLERCSKVESLAFVTSLPALTGLAITDFKNVRDLAPLSALRSLRALGVAGSMWTRMNVNSFAPLAQLRDLEFLHLTNIKAEDASLKPLAALTKLQQLEIANFYPMGEFARLSGKLPATECTWFRPYMALQHLALCKHCREETMVALTGTRKKRAVCVECDATALARHIEEWKQAAAQDA